MPNRPKRACTNQACIVLHSEGGRCAKCKAKRQRQEDRDRGSSAARGYGGRWQKYRERFLRRSENALCSECEARGFVTEATVVHHVSEDKALFWEPTNHQALCRRCHEVKHGRMRR